MMKVTLWLATSANNMIARENNEEDFLSQQSWDSWVKFVRKIGCIVWGAKTYEVVSKWKNDDIDDIQGLRILTISQTLTSSPEKNLEVVDSPEKALQILENEGFKEVVLAGGSKLNSSFAKLGLIDEIILNIEPVVIGQGIYSFSPELFDLKLELREVLKEDSNIVQLQYKVIK